MNLNESIIEDAALEWFLLRSALLNYGGQVGEQTRAARTLTPALSHVERESSSEVVLVGRLHKAIRRLNPAIPEEASACALHADRRATDKESLSVQNTSKGG
jgi:hypothetical protein